MSVTFGRGIHLWNFGIQQNKSKHDDSDYSVAKLRSLYATLLDAITPVEDITSTFSSNGTDSLRNFRRADGTSRSVRSASMDEEDEISFELFADASNTNSDFAWRRISATNIHVPPDESFDIVNSSSFDDNEAAVAELIHARKLEARVVELIRSIGEIVVYGEQRTNNLAPSGRSKNADGKRSNEAVFEYFCHKNMLSLLVDIVKAKPMHANAQGQKQMQYTGVIWTALVKAQVLQTISFLITNVSDPKSLYYLLSNNYINEVVASMIPLQQWTDKALDEILPVYVSFLKTLALQLTKSQELFQFFCDQNGATSSLPSFPLFYAAVEVVSSPSNQNLGQSDSFVLTTAFNIILNICQLQGEEIRVVIGESYTEQRMLLSHLCDELVERHDTIAYIMIGNRVDSERNSFLVEEVTKLEDDLHFMNDLLWCSHRKMNFRFCEYIMQYAIYNPIMEYIVEIKCNSEQMHGDTSVRDEEIYSEDEAKSESAILLLLKIFDTIDYTPLLKMIMVALIHPYSPTENQFDEKLRDGIEFILTPALNAIAQNEYIVVSDDVTDEDNGNFSKAVMEGESTTHILTNPEECSEESERSVTAVCNRVRDAMLLMLSGKVGNRTFILSTLLFESILNSKTVDFSMLKMLRLLPSYNESNDTNRVDSPIENALCHYFESLGRQSSSKLGADAAECAISFVLCYMTHLLQAMTNGGVELNHVEARILESKLFSSIENSKQCFASNCRKLKKIDGVSELFPDLTIAEISKAYCIVDANGPHLSFICDLASLAGRVKNDIFDKMIQTKQCSRSSETEDARFAIRRFLLLKALDDVFADLRDNLTGEAGTSSRWSSTLFSLQTSCQASKDIVAIGCLDKQSIVGTDVDARNKTTFYFAPSLAITDGRTSGASFSNTTEKNKRRLLADKILINGSSKTELILVVDPTELLVLKPKSRDDMEKGTILCCTLLNNIIAIAADGEWLHIAMRDVEDVGVLIKKGNMALRFENVETCQSAKRCINENRKTSKDSISLMIDEMLDC